MFKKTIKEWAGDQAKMRLQDRRQYLGGPSASPEILKIYRLLLEKSVQHKKKFRALLLGSTPELRDLVLKLGGELVTVDLSLEMLEKSYEIMKQKKAAIEREIIVIGDWLNNPLADNNFDVVLGDLSFINISRKKQEKLFIKIKKLLKGNGYVVMRNIVRNQYSPIKTVAEINTHYTTGQIHWFDVFMSLILESELTKRCFPQKDVGVLEKFNQLLQEKNKSGDISRELYQNLKTFQPIGKRTIMFKEKFDGLFKKYFISQNPPQAKQFHYLNKFVIFYWGKLKK